PVAVVLPGGRGSRQPVHRAGAWHAGRAVGRREVAHPAHAEPPGRRMVPALRVVHLAVACTAVGGRLVPTRTGPATLAERWNGHTWSIQPTPNPPGHGFKLLNGVACTSRSSCMAVGNEFDTTRT